jgi:hypothetical protein
MKLKILLLTIFAAGLSASLAFADSGKKKDNGPSCTPVHLEGTIAPQSLTLTVTHSGEGGAVAAGTQVTLAVGTTGQTVRVNVEACSTGTGSTQQFTVKHLELQPMKPKPAGSTTTTGDEHHGDKPKPSGTTTTSGEGEHEHKGGTTTTTTAATTTSPTTTTTP